MTQGLNRQLREIKSTLRVSINRDVRSTNTGKLLLAKGFISKNTGKLTRKGRMALKVL